jgi:cystathionine gamma-synthase
MVSFEIEGNLDYINHVLRTVKLFALAESLGGVESLIDHPMSMTHASMDPTLREEAGITENLIRLSIGLEDIEDILADLSNALARS